MAVVPDTTPQVGVPTPRPLTLSNDILKSPPPPGLMAQPDDPVASVNDTAVWTFTETFRVGATVFVPVPDVAARAGAMPNVTASSPTASV